MRRFAFTAFLVVLSAISVAQDKPQEAKPDKAEAKPTPTQDETPSVDAAALERVSNDIKYLASDELEGRGVETKGLAVAAEYIRDEFKKAGVKSGTSDGTYYQYFDVPLREKPIDVSKTSLKLVIDGKVAELNRGEDFQALTIGAAAEAFGEIVFVGYGITAPEFKYDDYAGIDVEGKVVLVLRREPKPDDEDIFDGGRTTTHSYVATKIAAARKAGAKAILFVNDAETTPDTAMEPNAFGGGGDGIPFIHITRETADQLIAASPIEAGDQKLATINDAETYINKEMKPCSQPLGKSSANINAMYKAQSVQAWNVIGVVEGEGPFADETVVVGAHYDHLGFGGYGSRRAGSSDVHNGADDNATGTAAVIELARRFAQAEKKPARRMVFIAFSGEERGLVGSAYYVENPTYALDKTVTMLNFDMIGNLRNNLANLGGVATGSGLQEVADAANEAVPVDVRIQRGSGGGSDHLNFLRKQIPVLFCNTGLTSLYHTPDDDYETLNMPGTVMVVDYCEKLLQGVVSLEKTPVFMPTQRRPRTRVFLGIGSRNTEGDEAEGLAITNVVADSPSAKAGLKVGDILQTIAGKKSTELRSVLSDKKPGDKITVGIIRDGESMELEVELAAPPRRNRRRRP